LTGCMIGTTCPLVASGRPAEVNVTMPCQVGYRDNAIASLMKHTPMLMGGCSRTPATLPEQKGSPKHSPGSGSCHPDGLIPGAVNRAGFFELHHLLDQRLCRS
jgi:hypothetical protein